MKDTVLNILNECHNNCTLIAVSKTKGADIIKEVYDIEIRDFGERNYNK